MTREEAKKQLVAYMYYAIDDMPEEVGKAFDVAISALSADVRPNIHGHWGRRIVDNGFNADWVCSECGHREYTDFIHMNFCPDCGADMREPKGEKGTE